MNNQEISLGQFLDFDPSNSKLFTSLLLAKPFCQILEKRWRYVFIFNIKSLLTFFLG